jgi:general secretion pathway protein L
MFQTTHNWELFGFDVRLIGRQWRSAWREFLWGSASPVLARLDETVRVHSQEAEQYFYAGRQLHHADPVAVSCDAILLPPDIVLSKTLYLPLAVETDLQAVMALEVGAHNPFPPGDTVSGWTIIRKTPDQLCIGLVIASASAVMTFLARHFGCHDARAYEVWARIDDTVVVLEGFGEAGRRQRYRQRLTRTAGMIVISAVLVAAIFGTFTAAKHFELLRHQEMADEIQGEAAAALQARQALLAASETISAVNKFVSTYPNPHVELARLTRLLGDGASIISFNMAGANLQLRGRAVDAAAVVQELTAEPAYVKVTSPQAITKLGSSGLEEFYIDIELAQGPSL